MLNCALSLTNVSGDEYQFYGGQAEGGNYPLGNDNVKNEEPMYGNICGKRQDSVGMDGTGQAPMNMDSQVHAQGNMGDNHGLTACKDINALIELLDGYTVAGGSRIKIDVVEGGGGVLDRQYHHGRCDVGSPWACGTAFDVLE